MEKDILTLPCLVEAECTTVLTCMVVPVSRERRIVLIVASPCISYIEIDRSAISIHFPKTGNRDLIP